MTDRDKLNWQDLNKLAGESYMTVGSLIKQLQRMDPNLRVMLQDGPDILIPINPPRLDQITEVEDGAEGMVGESVCVFPETGTPHPHVTR